MLTRPRALTTAATALATVFLLACDEAEFADSASEDVELRSGAGQGGPLFNTPKIFEAEVAAIDTQGGTMAGVRLVHLALEGGKAIDAGSLRVDHGTLTAQVQGQHVAGLNFVDSSWTFEVHGVLLAAKLVSVETASDARLSATSGTAPPLPGATLRNLDPQRLVYVFTYLDDKKKTHRTCESDAVSGARMVIYGDIVVDHELGEIDARPNSVYFACLTGAVGKAALWGYAPDSPSQASVPLPAFETAVRTVRADYCADGEAHTKVGNAVTLHDRWQINEHPPLNFSTEAVWEAGGGALCLNRVRDTGDTLLTPHTCPDGRTLPLCGKETDVQSLWAADYGQIWTMIK